MTKTKELYFKDLTIQPDPSNKRLGWIIQKFVMDEPSHFEFLGEDGWKREKSHFATSEFAEACAMGHGAVPLAFGNERKLIETAEDMMSRADECIRLKCYPTIDRYISEGNRQAAFEFIKQVPGSVAKAFCFDRARYHNPGGIEPVKPVTDMDEISKLVAKGLYTSQQAAAALEQGSKNIKEAYASYE